MAAVSVLVVDLLIPVTKDYIAMTSWVTVNVELGRTLVVVVLT